MRAALCGSYRPYRSRHRPNKTVPPGHDGSDFFLPIFISSHLSAACLFAWSLFATWILAYQYRPAPRPATIDTEDGEDMSCDAGGGSWLFCFASCGRRWMATVAEWLRCHACLISLVRCYPSHEMMRRRDAMSGTPFSFFARPPLPGSPQSACLNYSPAPWAWEARVSD